jgi:4-alpha-glucanotransferase
MSAGSRNLPRRPLRRSAPGEGGSREVSAAARHATMEPAKAGIEPHYVDALGRQHDAPAATLDAIRAVMARHEKRGQPPFFANKGDSLLVATQGAPIETGPAELRLEDGTSLTIDDTLPEDVPAGYHALRRRGARRETRLIVAPRSCYLPSDYEAWGWAIQLYAARSRGSWGIGDLADLRRLGSWARRDGASIALVNPLASATPVVPQQASPYFPSSRRFRNPLYLRPEDIDGAREVADLPALAARARTLNRTRIIERDRVYEWKLAAFEKIWSRVRRRRDERFGAYLTEQGSALNEYATFCALAERFDGGWHSWPAAYRRPDAAGVRRLSQDRDFAARVRFHAWLQYQADRQLARAGRVLPLMQDLPIGFDADGADAWAFQDVLADGLSVGAPPDEFNTRGQNWGLPPFIPHLLRDAAYEPFVQTIRACLRHAGGLRIDHVMGLFRLFWIPREMEPKDGAYVTNAADDLLAIVALESQRAKAVIVGEDLGTVEEDARRQLMARQMLSYRLVWFEEAPPARFPEQALAAVTTHDLPTVAGLWTGSDLDAQKRLHLSPNEQGTLEMRARVRQLTRASTGTPVESVIAQLHEALALTPARIVTATLEDAMAVEERPNMPATMHEWPNWSLALPQPIETLMKAPLAKRIAKAFSRRTRLRRSRGSGAAGPSV